MKSMKTSIYSIHILAAFLATMLLSACGGSSNSPEGVAKQFFTAITKGDVKTATACSTKENQKGGSVAFMVGLAQASLQEKGEIKNIETNPISVSGDTAAVKVITTFKKDGSTDETVIGLAKENGAWKVADVK